MDDSVTLRVPDIARGRGNFSNVMVKVIDIDAKGLITLGSKYWIINRKFIRGEIVPCFQSFFKDYKVPLNTISLRKLTRKESNSTKQGFFEYYCQGICNSKCNQSWPTYDKKMIN